MAAAKLSEDKAADGKKKRIDASTVAGEDGEGEFEYTQLLAVNRRQTDEPSDDSAHLAILLAIEKMFIMSHPLSAQRHHYQRSKAPVGLFAHFSKQSKGSQKGPNAKNPVSHAQNDVCAVPSTRLRP